MNRRSPTTAYSALTKPQVESLRVFEKYGCGQECQIHRSKTGIVLSGQPRAGASASPAGPKMIRFPPSPGDHLAALATKSAHLLRLTRHFQPYPRLEQNHKRSTCGFVSALFGMVGDRQLNVVDGPVLWRPPRPRTKVPPRRRETPPWRLGVGWGLCFWLPASGSGPLAPGRCQFA